jgi:hypothetical protein
MAELTNKPAPTEVEIVDWRTNTPFYLTREGPRPPGETGKYGPDVENSLAPDVYPSGKRE